LLTQQSSGEANFLSGKKPIRSSKVTFLIEIVEDYFGKPRLPPQNRGMTAMTIYSHDITNIPHILAHGF
jgi:hypothetical protein